MEEGIGLYIHVPYCLSRCRYCGFASSQGEPSRDFARALLKEIKLLSTRRIKTLYAGGGTPTLMGPDFWRSALERIRLEVPAEVTIETNPALPGAGRYRALIEAGFNRISIGIQSFLGKNLGFLGRAHTGEQGEASVRAAAAEGFENISLDLIYGLPEQSGSAWRSDLERALKLEPAHISCYELTLEPGTPVGDSGRKASEARCARMFGMAHHILTREGYIHYEVSNYALPGRESAHNLAYWNRTPYAGVGPSAHGFTRGERYWNTPDTDTYIELMTAGASARAGSEVISAEKALTEEVMLGLRTIRGVPERILPAHRVEDLVGKGMLIRRDGMVAPTLKGMLWADYLAGELSPCR